MSQIPMKKITNTNCADKEREENVGADLQEQDWHSRANAK